MDPQQDTSGDYGYDLAHEAGRQKGKPGEPAAGGEGQPSPADGRTEPDGDFGYDEAHGF